jgi:hypothetical protein
MTDAVATQMTAKRFGKREVLCGHWDRLADAVRKLFSTKPAPNMAAVTGLSVRACEYFLSRKTGLSSDAVVALLHTEGGLVVLEALMGPARPTWWKAFKRAAAREQMKAEIADLQKRIDALNGELP